MLGCTIWSGHAGDHGEVCLACWHSLVTCRCQEINKYDCYEDCEDCGSERYDCECKPGEHVIINNEPVHGTPLLDWRGNTWGAFWRYLAAWNLGMEVKGFTVGDKLATGWLAHIDSTDPILPFKIEYMIPDFDEMHAVWVNHVELVHFVIEEAP